MHNCILNSILSPAQTGAVWVITGKAGLALISTKILLETAWHPVVVSTQYINQLPCAYWACGGTNASAAGGEDPDESITQLTVTTPTH